MTELYMDLIAREHMRDLRAEAAGEGLARETGRSSLPCRLCLQLGHALMGLGQKLEDYGAGRLSPRLGAGRAFPLL
jgi:hypothetical protein